LFKDFITVLVLWALAGLGMTFVSGAEESWVIDNLNKYKRKDLHQEYFIKSQSIAAFGAILAPIIGAVLVNYMPLRWLWVIFGVGFLVNAALLSFFGREEYKPKQKKLFQTIKATFKNSKSGFKKLFHNKVLVLIIVASSILIVSRMGNDGWQPLLVEFKLPMAALGIVFSVASGVMMLSPFIARLFVRMKVKYALSLVTAIDVLLGLAILFIYPPAFIMLSTIYCLKQGLWSLKSPMLQAYVHKFIPTNIRATTVSAMSMLSSIIGAAIAPIGGLLMDSFGPKRVIALGGLLGVFAIATYLMIKD
jgi:MFS family permease